MFSLGSALKNSGIVIVGGFVHDIGQKTGGCHGGGSTGNIGARRVQEIAVVSGLKVLEHLVLNFISHQLNDQSTPIIRNGEAVLSQDACRTQEVQRDAPPLVIQINFIALNKIISPGIKHISSGTSQ